MNAKHKGNNKQQKLQFGLSTTRRTEGNLIGKDEQKKAESSTMLYELPLEILDIILKKSYLHWIVNSSTKQRDAEFIRSLISVDVCFNRRIKRKRFKNTIWRYLKDVYGKTKKRSLIIRNNRTCILENIQPNEELIASLLSLNCITEEQSHFIQRQRSNRVRNAELLYIVRSFDDTRFSNFVKCLRRTNQHTVARIMENGGGVIKVDVKTRGATYTTSMETQLLHQAIEDLRNRTRPRSHQTEKLISQLKDEGIEILNSHLDRQTVVVWIWCHSQAALEYIQRLYESNQLRYVFFEEIQPSISKMVNIDRNQFKKTIVVFPISINLTQRIDVGRNESVWGVTKLRNEIYIICDSRISSVYIFHVFEDQNPFRLKEKINIQRIKDPFDIRSSEKENCLYIAEHEEKCVWKVTKEGDQHEIVKWLTTDYRPLTLSLSNDGQLMVVSLASPILMIYGSDSNLIRSIQLPRDIKHPRHAVETSSGNFIIIYRWWRKDDTRESGSSGIERGIRWGISEVTRDGQMVIRCFVPSNETQELNDPRYLSINSDDQVFVADTLNGRVIHLDSDLNWNGILRHTRKEDDMRIRQPFILCYDEEKKQLIVGGNGAIVHTLGPN